jgi:hypothetical protein
MVGAHWQPGLPCKSLMRLLREVAHIHQRLSAKLAITTGMDTVMLCTRPTTTAMRTSCTTRTLR